jgi:hypothetical protein
MSKHIDTELLVTLVRETLKMYENQIDNASPEMRDTIKNKAEEGVVGGHCPPEVLDIPFEEVMAGLCLCDLAQKIVMNCHNLLSDPNTVRTVKNNGSQIIIEERPLSDSEIAANAAMGVSDLEQFIANINRNKE